MNIQTNQHYLIIDDLPNDYYIIEPNQDIEDEPENIKTTANDLWSTELKPVDFPPTHVTVSTNSHIQVRETLNGNFHRRVIKPGDDISTEHRDILQAAKRAWNAEVINNYLASIQPEPLTFEETQSQYLEKLRRDNNKYIYDNYDQGSQSSIQAIYNDPDSTQTQRDQCKAIFDWIKIVLAYYYQKKIAIRDTAETIADVEAVTWDFGSFDATKPAHTLESIVNAQS